MEICNDIEEKLTAVDDRLSWHEKGELPPAGSEIEVYAAGEEVRQIHVACSGDGVVFGWDMGAPFVYAHFSEKAYKFRPLKTERERFVEAAVKLNKAHQWTAAEFAAAMYDAGFKAPESKE